jgi:tRNA pseudouridine38-40 synthase
VRNIKLTIAYDGTDFCGWQIQPDVRTVQGELERALAATTGETIRTVASGRTDAGVHALGQVVSFQTSVNWPIEAFRRALATHVPEDIAAIAAEDVPADFHAIRSAQRKRYRYLIHDGRTPDVLRRRYSWHSHEPLDESLMRTAAECLAGTHDFRSFETTGAPRETTVRTIYEIVIRRGTSADWLGPDSHLITIEVEADGFLYNMMRSIAGTLALVGRGKNPPEWVAKVVAAHDRTQAGPTAPPQGLFLVSVTY